MRVGPVADWTWTRPVAALLAAALLAGAPGSGQPAGAADWLDVVARTLGISKTPSQLKAPGDAPLAGDVYVVNVAGGPAQRLTHDGSYRSPVFLGDDTGLLALRGDRVVRLSLSGGNSTPTSGPTTLHTVGGASKLLGVNAADPDEVLLLVHGADGRAQVASLSLRQGRLTVFSHDPASPDHRRLLASLRGDNREYEGVSLYLKTDTMPGLTGPLEWTDVYATRAGQPPVNLSHGAGASSGQPSLSHDRQRVAFIRTDPAR